MLAHLLAAPVVLVIDARGMTRGIAPLILGYQAFDRNIRIAGVILNQLGGFRHEAKLRAVIEHYTDVPVLGAVHHDERLVIVERHLGLVPSNEAREAQALIESIAERVATQVDMDRLLAVAASAPSLPQVVIHAAHGDVLTPDPLLRAGSQRSPHPHRFPPGCAKTTRTRGCPPDIRNVPPPRLPQAGEGDEPSALRAPPVRVGVACDAAFAFYYPDDLEALRAAGADLIPFDTLRDAHIPPVDTLFLGGGFPETHMPALEANASLREEIRRAIDDGMPVYAECGGLMYLSRSIAWRGRRYAMVGAIPADTVMHDRPQGRGYVLLHETGKNPWPAAEPGGEIRAHEFHYSSLENIASGLEYAYEVLRGTGIDGRRDGIVYNNVLACYSHLRNVETQPWAARFVEFVRQHKQRAANNKWQVARK